MSFRDTLPLTDEQYAAYLRDGLVRLPGFLPADRVAAAQAAVFAALERGGLRRDGAWRLAAEKPAWPGHGPSASKLIGNKHPELAALFDAEPVQALVEALLEDRPVDRRIYPRPMMLFSVPNAGDWTLANTWHTDAPRLASGRAPGVQLFSFLAPVGPRGGGTMAVAGSHRLLNDGRSLTARRMRHELGREPFFRQLWRSQPLAWAAGAEYPAGAVDNWPLRVVEMTGAPGDVWLMDLRTFHSASPNAAEVPRLMVTQRFIRKDVAGEIAEAHGWTKAAGEPVGGDG
jgi:ectoine hydroxylase-related dioxygenase (phytanoyl-CoA dioxygenase family)